MTMKSSMLTARARKVRLIAMDIDGVLTQGEIIILKSGEEVKLWNVKDRFGFHLAHRSGDDIRFAWISGRASAQVAARAREIGIEALVQDCMTKQSALETIAKRMKVRMDEIAYIGDDLVDIPVFRNVGLSVCPCDASPEVLRLADLVTGAAGGKGVLREVIDLVLKARGSWKKATRGYL